MEVSFSEQFKKAYQKRIKGDAISEAAFKQSLAIFIANPFEPKLKTHKLSGKLNGMWSFSLLHERIAAAYVWSAPLFHV